MASTAAGAAVSAAATAAATATAAAAAAATAGGGPPMRSALRKLCQHGAEALKPQYVNDEWRKPAVSKRVAAVLRKQAIIDGTCGSFNAQTGQGWDPLWDAPGKIGRLRPPKETKRERTREVRASKIDDLVEAMDDKIESFRIEMKEKKPEKNFDYFYKKAMKGKK